MEEETTPISEEESPFNKKARLETQKLEKEIIKIDIETRDLNKSWFRKPQWYSALFPFLLGAATIIVAWQTGFLNNQAVLNKIEAKEAAKQLEEGKQRQNSSEANFKIEKDKQDAVSKALKQKNDSLRTFVESLTSQKLFITNELDKLKDETKSYDTKLASLISRLSIAKQQLMDTVAILGHNNQQLYRINTGQMKSASAREDYIQNLKAIIERQNKKLKELGVDGY